MREPREEEDEEREREGGVEWRRLGRRGWNKAGRWDGRIEDNSMVRNLRRDLEVGEDRWSMGQPKRQSCAGAGRQPLALIGAAAPSRGGTAQLSCGRGRLCH